MSSVACIYFEGNDSKVALFTKENGVMKLVKGESLDTSFAFTESKADKKNQNLSSKSEIFGIEMISEDMNTFNRSYLQKLNEFFVGEDISKCKFIPVLTEPGVYYQKIRESKDLANLNITPNGKIDKTIDFVDLADGNKLAVYPSGQSNYLTAIDSLARMNNRKFLKIESVKCAEISLANFIARRINVTPNEISLIVYIGKDYSKIIFLKGNRLFHVGSTLSVGKNSFNSHRVLVSKVLLEMEHAGVNSLGRFIITGEDDSENIQTEIQKSFPDSQVSHFKIKDVEIGYIDKFSSLSSFIVPTSAAEEYFDQIENNKKGIDLLPNYVREQQKPFHLDWHGYTLIVLILLSISYFAYTAFSNSVLGTAMQNEINRLVRIQEQNKEAVAKINSYENKIKNVGQTKTILEQLSRGAGVLTKQMYKLSGFTESTENIWIRQMSYRNQDNLKIDGYTLNRKNARKLSDSYNSALLENVIYDPIKDTRYFKFSISAGTVIQGNKNAPKN